MANEFIVRKGLIVEGASGGTVVDIQGSQGQLFSVTDDLSGSIFAVSDISGVPIFDVNSSGTVTIDGHLTSKGLSFLNQNNQYNNPTPGITGYGNVAMDSSVSFYDTGKNISTSARGLAWNGRYYMLTNQADDTVKFYDNNFDLVTNPEASSITLPSPGTGSSPHGAAWDGRYLTILWLSPLQIVSYDLDNGTTTATLVNSTDISAYSTNTYDIEYADGHFYTCQGGAISKFKVEGKTVTHVLTTGDILGGITAQAITYDGGHLWFTVNGGYVYKVTLDCTLVSTLTTGFTPDNIGWAWNGQNIASCSYTTGNVYIINTAETRFDTEKFLVMGGNVGIGTTAPVTGLDVRTSLYSNTTARFGDSRPVYIVNADPIIGFNQYYDSGWKAGTSGWSGNIGLDTNGGIYFNTSASSVVANAATTNNKRMVILNNGSVGIGTTAPANGKLVIDSIANQIAIETGTAGDGRLNIGHFANGAFIGTYGDDAGAADIIRFGTHSGDERMRITSAGDVLVGKTAVGVGTDGVELRANGLLSASRTGTSSNNVAYFNRNPDGGGNYGDGAVIQLRKDNVVVGVLGTEKWGIGTGNPLKALHVVGDAQVTGAFYDSNVSAGTSGQVLSSTATGTDWIDASSGSTVYTAAIWQVENDIFTTDNTTIICDTTRIYNGTTSVSDAGPTSGSLVIDDVGVYEISYSVSVRVPQSGAPSTRQVPALYLTETKPGASEGKIPGSVNSAYLRLYGSNQGGFTSFSNKVYFAITTASTEIQLKIVWLDGTDKDAEIFNAASIPNTISIRRIT